MKRGAEGDLGVGARRERALRERINDVAAEVARLTSVLEGPGSTIDTILATPEHAPGTNGAAKPAAAANTNGDDKGSLADRIRALQARSSRLSSAT